MRLSILPSVRLFVRSSSCNWERALRERARAGVPQTEIRSVLLTWGWSHTVFALLNYSRSSASHPSTYLPIPPFVASFPLPSHGPDLV